MDISLIGFKKKAHMRAWTKSEIREFIAEGKKDFLEILKNMTEKTTDKKVDSDSLGNLRIVAPRLYNSI